MLADFRAGKFDIIVVWRVDRLTRSTYGMVDMVRELEPLGLRLYADDLGEVDLSTVEGRNRAIERAMRAEEESARKSERMKRANLQRAQRGRIKKGTRCFGYDGEFNIVPDEAALVSRIYNAYADGFNMSAITRAIQGKQERDEDGNILPGELPEDFPTSEAPNVIFERERKERRKRLHLPEPAPKIDDNGKPIPKKKLTTEWTLAVTQSILRNPRYAGYVYYNPVDKNGKCTPTNSNWEKFIVRDANGEPVEAVWPAIVNPGLWNTCQYLRNQNLTRKDGTRINKNGGAKKCFGAGVFRCSICGKPMHSASTSYRCDGHVNRMRDKVDAYVLAAVRARLAMPDLKDLLFQPDNEPDDTQERLEEARRKLNRAREDYEAELIDGAMYKTIRDKQTAVIESIERERIATYTDAATESVLTAPDPVAAFDKLDPGRMSKVIQFLCTVTLKPHQRGYRQTPESLAKDVIIEWNAH